MKSETGCNTALTVSGLSLSCDVFFPCFSISSSDPLGQCITLHCPVSHFHFSLLSIWLLCDPGLSLGSAPSHVLLKPSQDGRQG